jgi:hypothetical protein
MVANPVKGPSPSDPLKSPHETKTASSGSHRKIEKVEKVGEIDPEQQSKARKFRAMVDEDTNDAPDPKLPTPMKLFSDEEPAKPVPSPSYSSPPKAGAPAPKEEPTSSLPRSKDFWKNVDEPVENETNPPHLTERKKAPEGKKTKDEFTTSSHLGIPIREMSSTPFLEESEIKDKKVKKEEGGPNFIIEEPTSAVSRFIEKEEEGKETSTVSVDKRKMTPPEKPTERKKEKERPKFAEEEKEPVWTPPHPSGIIEKKSQKKEEPKVEIKGPTEKPLPVDVIPAATEATMAATPYLKPETLSLFYQMVGTIYVMIAPPGISRTEVILNSPSYAQSKFYGASIILEKYATAPHSFNIRLTGSNAAVDAFRQNIPALTAAFRKGDFSFNIGRIEAEYKSDKPVFHRKGKHGKNDLDGKSKEEKQNQG